MTVKLKTISKNEIKYIFHSFQEQHTIKAWKKALRYPYEFYEQTQSKTTLLIKTLHMVSKSLESNGDLKNVSVSIVTMI